MADPKAQIYSEPFKGVYTLFPDNAVAVSVAGGNVSFAQARTIYVGTAGDVVVTPAAGGSDVTFTVPAGGVVPVRASAVKQTGTTAGGLISVY